MIKTITIIFLDFERLPYEIKVPRIRFVAMAINLENKISTDFVVEKDIYDLAKLASNSTKEVVKGIFHFSSISNRS